MFKGFLRFLVILLVVALLGGAIYTLVQNKAIGISFGGDGFDRRASAGTIPAAAAGGVPSTRAFSPVRFGEGGEGRFSFSPLRGLAGVMGNSLAIGLITLAVVLVRKLKPPQLLRARPVSLDHP